MGGARERERERAFGRISCAEWSQCIHTVCAYMHRLWSDFLSCLHTQQDDVASRVGCEGASEMLCGVRRSPQTLAT
jgi:hypothetical protein